MLPEYGRSELSKEVAGEPTTARHSPVLRVADREQLLPHRLQLNPHNRYSQSFT